LGKLASVRIASIYYNNYDFFNGIEVEVDFKGGGFNWFSVDLVSLWVIRRRWFFSVEDNVSCWKRLGKISVIVFFDSGFRRFW